VRIFYSTDVHGSDRCFTKFVNAAGFYDVDALVLGGDITGKAIVPLVSSDGAYEAEFIGDRISARPGEELEQLEKRIANTGYYPWRCTRVDAERIAADEAARHELFVRLICERVERWMALAEERLRPAGTPCYVNAGNDDPHEIDAVIEASDWVEFLEGRVVRLPDGTELASCGYANKTPWACPRDVEEGELAQRLEDVIAKVEDPETALFNFHCPPYDTGIDSGPVLGEDLRVQAGAGGVQMQPVGSKACRAAIERYQPLAGLHGHLHESRGTHTLGRTVCINPGSEYTEGVLRGALLEAEKGELKNYQLTAG
jgi:Icc-related predicted phosphoesterase